MGPDAYTYDSTAQWKDFLRDHGRRLRPFRHDPTARRLRGHAARLLKQERVDFQDVAQWAGSVGQFLLHREELPGLFCPTCKHTTYHPKDVRESWCGMCDKRIKIKLDV